MTATAIETDVAIIGAGPVGLFAVFELGMLRIGSVLIDALGEAGGQCAALYPEKPIYDIPAHPAIEAAELVAHLERQIAPFARAAPARPPRHRLGRHGRRLHADDGPGDTVHAKAVMSPPVPAPSAPTGRRSTGLRPTRRAARVQYYVRKRDALAGKRVVIAGGGDSAVDWALALHDIATGRGGASAGEVPRRPRSRRQAGNRRHLRRAWNW